MIEPEHLGDVVSTGEHLAMRIDYEASEGDAHLLRHQRRESHRRDLRAGEALDEPAREDSGPGGQEDEAESVSHNTYESFGRPGLVRGDREY